MKPHLSPVLLSNITLHAETSPNLENPLLRPSLFVKGDKPRRNSVWLVPSMLKSIYSEPIQSYMERERGEGVVDVDKASQTGTSEPVASAINTKEIERILREMEM